MNTSRVAAIVICSDVDGVGTARLLTIQRYNNYYIYRLQTYINFIIHLMTSAVKVIMCSCTASGQV